MTVDDCDLLLFDFLLSSCFRPPIPPVSFPFSRSATAATAADVRREFLALLLLRDMYLKPLKLCEAYSASDPLDCLGEVESTVPIVDVVSG